MIVFVGQVGGDMVDREAFQEIDYRRMFGSVAKWAAQIDRADRIPEYVAHAYRARDVRAPGTRRAGAAGGHADVARRRAPMRRAWPRCPPHPGADADRRGARDAGAARARRWCWSAAAAGTRDACAALRTFAEAHALPVACAFRHQDLFDNRHPQLRRRRRHRHQSEARRSACATADVLLVIGERLGEMTTGGYTLLDAAGAARSS